MENRPLSQTRQASGLSRKPCWVPRTSTPGRSVPAASWTSALLSHVYALKPAFSSQRLRRSSPARGSVGHDNYRPGCLCLEMEKFSVKTGWIHLSWTLSAVKILQ